MDDLLTAWAFGWTIARGVAPPIGIAGGLRIDTRSPKERVRYVLFTLDPARIATLAATDPAPLAALKVCGDVETLARHLPAGWLTHEQRFLMSAPLRAMAEQPGHALDKAYELTCRSDGRLLRAEIRDRSGHVVASGRAAVSARFAVVDDVGTDPGHRRRGLGTLVMTSLNLAAVALGAEFGLLVATPDGRALYEASGWQVETPYASAYRP